MTVKPTASQIYKKLLEQTKQDNSSKEKIELWESAKKRVQQEVLKWEGRQSTTDLVTNVIEFLEQNYNLTKK
jgi:hypothetical protein